MTLEQRLKNQYGELLFTIAVISHELDQVKEELDQLKKEKNDQTNSQ